MDVDFRHSGTAPFTPASSTGVKEEELEALDEGQRREKLAGPELLKRKQEGLQRELEDELSNIEYLAGGVCGRGRAGFVTGCWV